MIELINVNKSIKKNQVLINLNLKFEEGKSYLLKGHNGSGKTMLLRLLVGLITPSSGNIKQNKDYSYGVIIENPTFFKSETAFYNLKYLANIKNLINEEDINKTLELFNLLEYKNSKVKSFSLGMTQRLALCQAIMENPDVLVLDEPFNAIDETNVEVLIKVLQEYRKAGKIVIVAAHSLPFSYEEIFDEVLTLNSGKVTSIENISLESGI